MVYFVLRCCRRAWSADGKGEFCKSGELFSLFEERFPSHLKELCNSVYFPFACSEMKEPWNGIPFLEVPEKQFGYLALYPAPEIHPFAFKLYYLEMVNRRTMTEKADYGKSFWEERMYRLDKGF